VTADDDPISREAWRREASHHAGHRNFRPHLRPKGANLMGLRGEQAFAERYGLEVNLEPSLGGDGGKDLKIALRRPGGEPCVFPVDCKAAIIPKDLIVEVARARPQTIYVLCRYWEELDRCTLLGWDWGAVLMTSKPKDYGYGVINYWLPRGEIHPMSELDAMAIFGEDWF